ncbi:MAG: glycogen/starch synthase [Prevotella sp.]|nr:glycogen/starch synthase [Prevotella sp.]
MPRKVLFINQETSPYVPDSVMAGMGRELPERAQAAGCEIRTFMPKWGLINERRGQLHEVIRLSGMNLVVNDNDHPLLIKVASLPVTRVQVYFIDNDEYFGRRFMTLDAAGNEFEDNGERAIFFARGALETVKKLRWKPDVVVCQGWMAAVVPLYIRTVYSDEPCLADTKIITSLFETGFKGELEEVFKQCLEYKEVTSATLKKYKPKFDFDEMIKLAVDYSDAVAVTSPAVDQAAQDYARQHARAIDCPHDDLAPFIKLIEDI